MKRYTWTAAALALLACIPGEATAQRRLYVEARGGLAVPAGDLADMEKVGGTFGGGAGCRVHGRVALRADFDALFMEGRGESGPVLPGVNLFHTTAGVEVTLTREGGPFILTGNLGAGTTELEVEAFIAPGGTARLDERYLTANAGVRLAYPLGRRASALLAAQAYLTFADEDDTAILEPLGADRFGRVLTFPLTAGLRVGL